MWRKKKRPGRGRRRAKEEGEQSEAEERAADEPAKKKPTIQEDAEMPEKEMTDAEADAYYGAHSLLADPSSEHACRRARR